MKRIIRILILAAMFFALLSFAGHVSAHSRVVVIVVINDLTKVPTYNVPTCSPSRKPCYTPFITPPPPLPR